MNISRREQVIGWRKAGLTYAEIGHRLGLSGERIRQIIRGKATIKKNPPANDPDVLLTGAQAAELLNVHVNTVRRWSDKGILETYRIGPRGDRRLRRRDIDNFLTKKSSAGGSQSAEHDRQTNDKTAV